MIPRRYAELLTALKEKIRHGRSVAVFTVNSQMLTVYWEIGNAIDDLVKAGGWGAKTVDHVAADLKTEFLKIAATCRKIKSRRPASGSINSIGSSSGDFRSSKNMEGGLFYLQKTVEQGWSRNVLINYVTRNYPTLSDHFGKIEFLQRTFPKDNLETTAVLFYILFIISVL